MNFDSLYTTIEKVKKGIKIRTKANNNMYLIFNRESPAKTVSQVPQENGAHLDLMDPLVHPDNQGLLDPQALQEKSDHPENQV